MQREYWDDRYGVEELIFGAAPNDFLREMGDRLPRAGAALDLGAGEASLVRVLGRTA